MTNGEEEPIYFDRNNSWWPTSLRRDDPFNGDFKLTIKVGNISENKDIAILVLFRGQHFLLGRADDVSPNVTLVARWGGDPPTAGEFFEALGETIEETETLDISWEVGYLVSDTQVVITDAIETSIYVVVPGIDIMQVAIIGATVAGVGALLYGILKKPKTVAR